MPELQDPTQAGIAPPRVIPSEEIVGHVDRAMASLPPEAQQAVAHAHGIVSGSPQSTVTAPPPSIAPPPSFAANTPSGGDSPFSGIEVPRAPITPIPSGDPGVDPKSLIKPMPLADARVDPMSQLTPMAGTTDSGSSSVPGMVGVSPNDIAASQPEAPLPPGRNPSPRIAGIESSPGMIPPMKPYVPGPSAAVSELQRLQTTGSGVHQIHNPFLKALATIGDVAGSGIFPGFAQFVPGTSVKHARDVQEAEGAVKDEQTQKKSEEEAATAEANQVHIAAEAEELKHRGAREDAQAQAALTEKGAAQVLFDKAGNAIGYHDPKSAQKFYGPDDPNLPPGVHDIIDAAKPKPDPNNPFTAWRKQNPDAPVEDYLTAVAGAKVKPDQPITAEVAKQLNDSWNAIAPKYHLPMNPFSEHMTHKDVAAVQQTLNNVTGKEQGGQKIVIEQQRADTAASRDPNTEKEYKSVHDDLNKKFATAETQLQNIDQAQAEINSGAMGQAFGTIKSLVALAGGQGSGVRITQAELNSIANARGLKGGFEGWLNGLEGKGKLSGDQVRDLNSILAEVKRKGEEKRALLGGTLDKLAGAKNTKEIRDIEKEYRDSGTPVDPKVKAYADAHFGGDVAKAQAAIAEQRKGKK